jgi:hypothetical protein
MAVVCISFIGDLPMARGRVESPQMTHPSNINQRDESMARILSVVESRCEGSKITGKVKDKLFTMSDKQIRLIASLADLIANNSQIPGADIVFFVITMLIIVS